ncbi:MAG: hypothetical protein HRF49_08370 [bacterium]
MGKNLLVGFVTFLIVLGVGMAVFLKTNKDAAKQLEIRKPPPARPAGPLPELKKKPAAPRPEAPALPVAFEIAGVKVDSIDPAKLEKAIGSAGFAMEPSGGSPVPPEVLPGGVRRYKSGGHPELVEICETSAMLGRAAAVTVTLPEGGEGAATSMGKIALGMKKADAQAVLGGYPGKQGDSNSLIDALISSAANPNLAKGIAQPMSMILSVESDSVVIPMDRYVYIIGFAGDAVARISVVDKGEKPAAGKPAPDKAPAKGASAK